jgi:hypothetical protein
MQTDPDAGPRWRVHNFYAAAQIVQPILMT